MCSSTSLKSISLMGFFFFLGINITSLRLLRFIEEISIGLVMPVKGLCCVLSALWCLASKPVCLVSSVCGRSPYLRADIGLKVDAGFKLVLAAVVEY